MRNHFLRASTQALVGGTDFVLTDSAVNNTAGSSHTFSAVDIGAAATGRLVIVSIGADGGSSGRAVSAVTIGGNSAPFVTGTSGVAIAAIAWAIVEAGTTTTVVVSYSGGNATDCQIHVGYVLTTGNTVPLYDSYSFGRTGGSASTTFSDTTLTWGRSLVLFSAALDSTLSTTPPSISWSGLEQDAADVIDTTDDFHITASAIVDGPSSLSWSATTGYVSSLHGVAISIPIAYEATIARPTSETNWDLGAVADVNEVTPDLNDYLADTSSETLTISFGSLTIPATGPCMLRFYEAEYNQNDGAPSNTADAPVWNTGAIAGYSLFTSLNPSKASWRLREYSFDASNISSGTITFSFTQVRDGTTGDRTGGAIAWMEFMYPPS